ncbi:MAG: DUF4416 family protein [bacterium]
MDEFAVFVVGLIGGRQIDYTDVSQQLADRYGEINFTAEAYPFNFTDYYNDELGADLQRRWLVFSEIFSSSEIVGRKKFCEQLEDQYRRADSSRRINIDPGYVFGAKFVLSSRKNNAHRIYLGNEVFAEVTLLYKNGGWKALDWTYPEFSTADRKIKWLNRARKSWLEKRN